MRSAALCIPFLLLLAACATITSTDAEVAARDFAREHVKFYSGNRTGILDTGSYDLETLSVEKAGNDYTVLFNVSLTTENETKSTTVQLVVDGSGRVTSFNGQPVPQDARQ